MGFLEKLGHLSQPGDGGWCTFQACVLYLHRESFVKRQNYMIKSMLLANVISTEYLFPFNDYPYTRKEMSAKPSSLQ